MTLKRPRGVCLIIANRFQLKCQVKKARNLSKRHFWLITLTTITINSNALASFAYHKQKSGDDTRPRGFFFLLFGLYFHFVASLLIISLEQLENFVGLIDSRVAAKVNGPFVPASHLFKRSFHFSYLLLLICVFVLLIYVFRWSFLTVTHLLVYFPARRFKRGQ